MRLQRLPEDANPLQCRRGRRRRLEHFNSTAVQRRVAGPRRQIVVMHITAAMLLTVYELGVFVGRLR